MFWAMVICGLSYQIYFNYNEFFREKEVYYRWMYKKTTDKSLGKAWKLCNDGGFPCFGNGNYDFREIMLTPETYEAAAERIRRLLDPKLNDAYV